MKHLLLIPVCSELDAEFLKVTDINFSFNSTNDYYAASVIITNIENIDNVDWLIFYNVTDEQESFLKLKFGKRLVNIDFDK